MSRTHNSDRRSESVSRTVTSVGISSPSLPEVGSVQFRRTSIDIACYLSTGAPFYLVVGHGRTEELAEDAARARYDELLQVTAALEEARARRELDAMMDAQSATDDEFVMSAAAEDRRALRI